MLARRLSNHSGLRLPALAFIFGSVRAIIDRREMRARRSELLHHLPVHSLHHRLRKKSAAHTRLIGDDDHWQVRIVQSTNGPRRERKHTKLADVIQVPDVFRNSPVSIQKNRRPRQPRIRQDAPPRRRPHPSQRAKLVPLPSHSRTKRASYTGDPSDIAARNTANNTAYPGRSCTSASPAPSRTDRSAQKSPPPAIPPPTPHASLPNRW